MSEKHYPYIGGSFDRIVFDGDGSAWVPESENAKLRELVRNLHACNGSCPRCIELMGRCEYEEQLGELGIEVEDV